MVEWRGQARKITAIALVAAAFMVLYRTENSVNASVPDLAGQFAFSRHTLPEVPGPAIRYFRQTAQACSTSQPGCPLGAGAALNDLTETASERCLLCGHAYRSGHRSSCSGDGRPVSSICFGLQRRRGRSFLIATRWPPWAVFRLTSMKTARWTSSCISAGRTPIVMLRRPATTAARLGPKDFVPSTSFPAVRFG